MQRCLSKCALSIFQKPQLLDFLDPVQQPTPWSMAAMISRRKFCFSRVLPLEHSGRMRHANEKHRVLAGFCRCVVKCTPGMLLQHVVDVLDARELALANTIHSFVQPANRRPKGNSVIPNFSFTL